MEIIEHKKNMTLGVRKSKQQKSNVRKSAKRKSGKVRKIAKLLKGTINYFAIWKRQNLHKSKIIQIRSNFSSNVIMNLNVSYRTGSMKTS